MKENSVCEQSYYHWQRKFRQQSYELMKDSGASVPAIQERADVDFVEIPCIPSPEEDTTKVTDNLPVVVIRTSTMSVEISNDISDRVLAAVLREVSHA